MDISFVQSMAQFSNVDELQRRVAPSSDLIRSGMSEEEKLALREATEAFEAYFLQMMMREMRRTLNDEQRIIPKSHAERIFTDMLDEENTRQLAQSGGVGLADAMFTQMTRTYSEAMPRRTTISVPQSIMAYANN
jgi:flagellar protein FlgJ